MTVVTMICVYHLLEVKLGQVLWDTELWMNGDHGSLMTKLLGTLTHFSHNISIFFNNFVHKVLQFWRHK